MLNVYTSTVPVTGKYPLRLDAALYSVGSQVQGAAIQGTFAAGQAPTANRGGPYVGGTGMPLQFTGGGASNADLSGLTYEWTFGDGSTGSGPSPTHAYGTAGTYTVTLTVTNSDGLSASAATVATVTPVEAVWWTNVVGSGAVGSTLTKTAGTRWGNAGAVSTRALASGDGFVEFGSSGGAVMAGLGSRDTDQGYADIEYAVFVALDNGLRVYESGELRGSFGFFSPGDRLRVSIEGGVVKYRRNGILFYASTVSPSGKYPLRVDTALYSRGASVEDAVMHGASLDGSLETAPGSAMTRLIAPTGNPVGGAKVAGSTIFFAASDPVSGVELWRSDGTREGTTRVKDINPGPADALKDLANAAVLDGTLYFAANDGNHGVELWRSDGTEAGTFLVRDVRPGSGDGLGTAPSLTEAAGQLFLVADDGTHGRELWRTDGSEAGTALVADIHPTTGAFAASAGGALQAMGSRVVFAANDGIHGYEPWISDGSGNGTRLIRDVNPGLADGAWVREGKPARMTVFRGEAYFSGSGTWPRGGYRLWKTDGTEGGTVELSAAEPVEFEEVGDALFFADPDGLSRTDGTAQGTLRVAGDWLTSPSSLTRVGTQLFFVAERVMDGAPSGRELFRSDGSRQGTAPVTDLCPETAATVGCSSLPQDLVEAAGLLYFTAREAEGGSRRLWRSDGTATGTLPVDIGVDNVRPLGAPGATLLVAGVDRESGPGLWALEPRQP